jgi:hypothetical protein
MAPATPEPSKALVPQEDPHIAGFGDGYRFQYSKTHNSGFWSAGPAPEGDVDRTVPHIVVPKAANDEESLDSYDRLAFAAEVSVRYHNRRKHHFDTTFRLMMMGVIVMAAAGMMLGVGQKIWMGLGAIGLAAGTLVWNVTTRAREHDVLRSEYQTLLEQIRSTPEPTAQDIRNWRNLRLRIQIKEPPVYWAVANDCYYDVARAWGLEPRQRPQPPVMLRPFINWFRF